MSNCTSCRSRCTPEHPCLCCFRTHVPERLTRPSTEEPQLRDWLSVSGAERQQRIGAPPPSTEEARPGICRLCACGHEPALHEYEKGTCRGTRGAEVCYCEAYLEAPALASEEARDDE